MLKILVPRKQGVFRIAGDEFAAIWKKSTGETLPVVTRDDGKSDLIVLGSDAVNAFTHAKIIEKVIPQFRIRTNTDDYQLISAKEGKRNLLFLAGGRGTARQNADCQYIIQIFHIKTAWYQLPHTFSSDNEAEEAPYPTSFDP